MACLIRPLDTSLQRYARQGTQRGVARVFVASPVEQPHAVAGFYRKALLHYPTGHQPMRLRGTTS
ncbi:hypothetical protein ACJU26_13200 [Acidithiobacillus sp. M4-SHS-6]|uniref:hypothetical protein n=1 Tax=Acidithiobacillus sp. M4-SHS-6 TaxID=3383024 RepID=UPI0039BE698D